MHHHSRQQQQQQQPDPKFSDQCRLQSYSPTGNSRPGETGEPVQKLPISSSREIRVEADQNFAIHFKGFRRLPLLLLQPRGTARRRTAACYTAPQTIKKSFTEKFVHIFQPKPPKLAAKRSETASRTRFPSCHIYQLRLGLKFGILEAWSWSAECPRLATVGLASSSSAAATASCENGALSTAASSPARLLASTEASL